jgi:hypothetical protein
MRADNEQPKRGPNALRALLVLSLVLNAALGLWLARRTPSSVPVGTEGSFTNHPAVSPLRRAEIPEPAIEGGLETNALSFRWSDIESTDYRQYIANLRAIGCPEQTIHDLVEAELNELYASRQNAIWKRFAGAYWQKQRNDGPSPDQTRQLYALGREKSQVLKDLFGSASNPQVMVDMLYVQVHGNEQQLLFLPEEKRQAALEALGEGRAKGGLDFADENVMIDPSRFENKINQLAQVLSPDELKEFRVRNSPVAESLRNTARYLNCTPEEFESLLESREQAGGGTVISVSLVRDVLGDDRAKEFERVSNMNYLNGRSAADRAGLPDELGDQVGTLTADALAQAQRLAGDNTLTPAEIQARLKSLQSDTEAKLDEMVGKPAAVGLRSNLRRLLWPYFGRPQ